MVVSSQHGWGWSPKQHSTGGKPTLLGISKRGDTYLRTLLIHGARAMIRVAERKAGHAERWLARLLGRRNKNIAAVALAVVVATTTPDPPKVASVVPKSEFRHRLAAGAVVLTKSVLSGLHHEYSVAPDFV